MKRLLAFFLVALLCIGALVACGGSNGLDEAANNLKQLHKDVAEATPADYEVPGKLSISGNEFTVTWTVDVTEGVTIVVAEDGKVTVDVNEKTDADIAYVLTATIKAPNGDTTTVTFNHKVPKFAEQTWAEYMAKEDDEAVIVKGVVTAIFNGENEKDINMQDADGGYYLYKVNAIPEGLKVGMTIRATGLRDTYNGGAQVAKATIEILDETIQEIKPIDITEAFKNAATTGDASLTKYNAMLVTMSGATVLGQNAGNNTYWDFMLDGLYCYVRISTSNSFLSKDQQNAFEEIVNANLAKDSTVTGVVSMYSNKVYIVPVDENAFSNFVVADRTPQEQVEFEANLLTGSHKVTSTGSVDLETTARLYNDVKITWALKEASAYAYVDGTKLNVILAPTATDIVAIATLTNGDASTTKEVTFKLEAAPTSIPNEVAAPVAGEANLYKLFLFHGNLKQNLYITGNMDGYYLELSSNAGEAVDVFLEPIEGKEGEYSLAYMVGKAKGYISVYASGTYINIAYDDRHNYDNTYKWDAEKGALTTEVKKDDGTTVTCFLGTRGTYDTMSAYTIDKLDDSYYLAKFATMTDIATIPDADKVAATKNELNIPASTAGNTTVTLPLVGKTFSNVTIAWAADNDAIVSISGSTMTVTAPDAATNVTLTATITCGATTETVTFTIAAGPMTPANIVDAAYALGEGETLGEFTLTGMITKINTAFDAQYNNITVTIIIAGREDKPIECYRLKGTGADTIKVGDTITVTGTIKNYYGKVEFDAKCNLDAVKTPADIAEIGKAGTSEEEYTLIGVITEITDAYNAQHGNISVKVDLGNGLVIGFYRLKGTGADTLAVGDTIVATGNISNYKGAVQLAQGCKLISVEKAAQEGGEEGGNTPAAGATIDFTAQGYENSAPVTSVAGTNFTVTFDKATNNNAPAYYNSGSAIRVYGGSTLTVTAAEGYTIKSITFTFGSGDKDNAITVDVGTLTDATWTGDASAVVFTVGGTSGHRRFATVTVEVEANA